MSYRHKHPTFSFRIEFKEKIKLDKLAKIDKISTNELARKIITKFLNNELIQKTEDLQTEKMKLQIEKLKAEIKYAQIKNNYFETFNKPMSRSATVTIKPTVMLESQNSWKSWEQQEHNPQSPYDEKNRRLQCIDCGRLWNWYSEAEFNSQLHEFQMHLTNHHNRAKTEIERQVLIDLKYEGNSA